MLFRSRPQDVEAVHWTGDNQDEVLKAIPDKTVFRTDSIKEGLWLYAGADGAQG